MYFTLSAIEREVRRHVFAHYAARRKKTGFEPPGSGPYQNYPKRYSIVQEAYQKKRYYQSIHDQ